MPYISQENRQKLDPIVAELVQTIRNNDNTLGRFSDGDVNYVITKVLISLYGEDSYYVLNRGVGVINAVQQEFYRTIVVPYEDQKRYENGDVEKC